MSSIKKKNLWTTAQEVSLISFYSKNEFLWNHSHTHFTNKSLRQSAIEMFLVKFLEYEFLPAEVEEHFDEMKTIFFNHQNNLDSLSENSHYKKLSFLLENGQEKYNFYIPHWTVELEVQLIQSYSEHPCLWNRSDKDYKNSGKKMSLYKEFAKSFDDNRFSVEQVREKFRRMKAVFLVNYRRVEKSLKSENVFKPTYIHFEAMKFLLTDLTVSDSVLSEGIFENVETVDTPKIIKPKQVRARNKQSPIQMPEFTREVEKRIIHFYSYNQGLWDTKHRYHNHKAVKQSVLEVLAHQLGNPFTVESIIEKFRRMRSVFHSNQRQLEISTERGELYTPSYIHYNDMTFLNGPPPVINKTENGSTQIIKSIYICRVCLNEDKDLKEIDHITFEFCTGINLTAKDYSSNICVNCEKLLSTLYEFKKRCISTDKTIEQFYSTNIIAREIKDEELEIFAEPLDNFTEITEQLKEEETEEEPDFLFDEPMAEEPAEEVVPKIVLDDTPIPEEVVVQLKRTRKSNASKFKLCPHCGKMVFSRYFKNHLKSHTKDPNIRFPCDLCDKTFTLKENVASHKLSTHAKMKKWACGICDEKFIYISSKRRHLANFHKVIEKKFICKICGNKYLIKSQLEKHMPIHTNEKPIQCDLCPKRFRIRGQLNHHMVTHTKEKNHKCEFCEKSFTKRSSLMMHVRIHTGLRDYVCPVCSKDFIQNHVMRAHCRSNHPEHELPPSGTIASQRCLKKLKEAENENKVD